jgi:hypothetical protein
MRTDDHYRAFVLQGVFLVNRLSQIKKWASQRWQVRAAAVARIHSMARVVIDYLQ